MLKLYRVIKPDDFSDEIIKHRATRRVPGNVPYLVDNLWEWLRPEAFPSRRRCVCASPTPALAHFGDHIANTDHECLTEVTLLGKAAIAQAPQQDVKDHPDVRTLPKAVLKFLGTEWTEQAAGDRLNLSPLFLPVVLPEEVDETLRNTKHGQELCEVIRTTSTFWQDAKLLTPTDDYPPFPEGEIFFEPFDGYRLNRV